MQHTTSLGHRLTPLRDGLCSLLPKFRHEIKSGMICADTLVFYVPALDWTIAYPFQDS